MKSIIIGLKMYLLNIQDSIVKELGFDNVNDFFTSSFNVKLLLFSSNLILLISAATQILADSLGLKPQILIGFAGLIILEFWTGVKAAIIEKKQDVDKLTRVFTKLTVYGVILFILNSMTGVESFQFLGYTISLFDYIFWICFCGISFKLTISIFGNLDRMGWEEASFIYKILHGKLQLFIDFDRKKTNELLAKLNEPEIPTKNEVIEDDKIEN